MSDPTVPSNSASQMNPPPTGDRSSAQSNTPESATTTAASSLKVAAAPIALLSARNVKNKPSPLQAAKEIVERFLETLQYPDYRLLFGKYAMEYLTLYAEYYCESKVIQKAEENGFHPGARNCGCYLNFQPRERVKESPAYKTLADESSAIISSTVNSLKDLYLKGLELNSKDRKAELMELLCEALPAFANLVLIDCELEKVFTPHDLVADLLLRHHNELFDSVNMKVEHFTQLYRRHNNCGHEPKSKVELFKLHFPEETEMIAIHDSYSKKNIPASSAKTAAAMPQSIAAGKPSKPAAAAPAASEALAASVAPAAAAALTTKSTAITPSINKNMPLNRAIDFDAMASNIAGLAGGSTFLSADKVAAITAFVSTVMATPASTSKSTTTPSSPATLIFPPYKGANPYFNKNTDNEDRLMIESCDKALSEKELEEQEAATRKELNRRRMKECFIATRVDSIRPKSTLGLPTPPPHPPDSGTPPVFPPNPPPIAPSTTGMPNATNTTTTNSRPTTNTVAMLSALKILL